MDSQNPIPRFDLAEEIMAEQRKITAMRRKSPGETKAESHEKESLSTGYIIGQPAPRWPEQEQIISEIVARDIEKLCKGGSLGSETPKT